MRLPDHNLQKNINIKINLKAPNTLQHSGLKYD